MLLGLFILMGILVSPAVAPSGSPRSRMESPPKWHPGTLKAPDDEKFLYTDDDRVVNNVIASGYTPRYEETVVPEVEELTPFRITLQDYYNTNVCVQRVRIYVRDKEARWTLRDSLLANCEGGSQFIPRGRFRFGFTNAIHFLGGNHIIYKIYWGKENWKCHERTYTKTKRNDKDLNQGQCINKIKRIYT